MISNASAGAYRLFRILRHIGPCGAVVIALSGCARMHATPPPVNVPPPTLPKPASPPAPPPSTPARKTTVEHGEASYYSTRFAGHPTASGEPFNPKAMTAASRTLPLGTKAQVTNLDNGRQVTVRINDRGPYVDKQKRIIDLSRRAAKKLHMLKKGVAPVAVKTTQPEKSRPAEAN